MEKKNDRPSDLPPEFSEEEIPESYGMGKSIEETIKGALKATDHDLAKHYSEDLISDLSSLGTEPLKVGEKGLSQTQSMVAFCVANGMPVKAIAENASVTAATINNWIRTHAAFRTRVNEIRTKLGLQMVSDKFESIAARATEVAEEIMEDADVNPSTRLQAAIHFIEQTRGKPTQKVEHKDNLLQTLLSKIDGDAERNAIDRYVKTKRTPEPDESTSEPN